MMPIGIQAAMQAALCNAQCKIDNPYLCKGLAPQQATPPKRPFGYEGWTLRGIQRRRIIQ